MQVYGDLVSAQLEALAGDPANTPRARIYFDTGTALIRYYDGSGWVAVPTLTSTSTLTNKTLTSPVLVTPTLGVASATSINKVAVTAPATGATLTLDDGSTLATSGAYSTTLTATATTSLTLPTTGTLVTLNGSEVLTNKTLTTPTIVGPIFSHTSGTNKNVALNIGSATNAKTTTLAFAHTDDRTITFPDASTTIVGTDTTQTLSNKTLTTPVLGAATATSINGLTITSSTGALTIANGKTLSLTTGSLTLASNASDTVATMPASGSITLVDTATVQTLTNKTLTSPTLTTPTLGAALATSVGLASSSYHTILAAQAGNTGNRTLTIDLSDVNRTLTLRGSVSFGRVSIQSDFGDLLMTANGAATWTIPATTDTFVGKATTDTLTNKTLTSGTLVTPIIDDYAEFNEESAPSSPSSGKVRVYAKTDKKLYLKDSAGTETQVGAGGSGELNLIDNPSDANNWTETGTRFNSQPTTTTTAGDLPLGGTVETAIKIVSSTTVAGDETTDYVSYPFTTGAAQAQKMKVEFYMRPGSNFVASEWTVSVWDTAGPTRQVLSTDSSSLTYLPNATGKFTTTFDAAASTSYTLRFTRRVAGAANAATLNIANVIVGPGIQPQGAVIGPWRSYTPAGNPGMGMTWTLNKAFYRRVGDSMDIEQSWSISNATGLTGAFSFTSANYLPSGTSFATGQNQGWGVWYANDNSAGSTADDCGGALIVGSTGTLTGLGGTIAEDIIDSTWPIAWAASDSLVIRLYGVPIAEWAGSGTIDVAQNDVEYAYTTGTWDADDSTTGYGPAGATMGGALTAYRTKTVRFQTPIQATDVISVEIDPGLGSFGPPDGVYAEHFTYNGYSDGYGVGVRRGAASTDVDVHFGRYRRVSNTGTYAAAGAAWVNTYKWRVKKVSGGQAVGFGNVAQSTSGLVKSAGQLLGTNTNDSAATGYVGEYKENNRSSSTPAITSNTYTSIDSGNSTFNDGAETGITLTAGDWDITGLATFTTSGAVTVTSVVLFIGTATGTGITGADASKQGFGINQTSCIATGSTLTANTGTYRVSLNATTTYYLKTRVIHSGGTNVTAVGCIRARRIR